MRYLLPLLLTVGCVHRSVPPDPVYKYETIRTAGQNAEPRPAPPSEKTPIPRGDCVHTWDGRDYDCFPKECASKRAELEASRADLVAAKQERVAWRAKHCKQRTPTDVSIRLMDGERFEQPSARGPVWVCDDGQITNDDQSHKEWELVRTAMFARRFIEEHCGERP